MNRIHTAYAQSAPHRASRMRRFASLVACLMLPFSALGQVGVTTPAGSAGSTGTTDNADGTLARFNNPAGLAADGTYVYVADSANNRVRRLTISTGAVAIFGTTVFSGPSGVAVDGSGNAYVADTGNHVIRKIDTSGVVTIVAGAAGVFGSANSTLALSRFNNPQGIAVNAGGTVIYVADTGNNLIRRIDVSGDAVTTIASGFKPVGLALNSTTDLYVTTIDGSGEGHTIRRLTLPGHVLSTIAGLAGTSGSTDANGTSARFNNPNGIAIDSAGDLYVADSGNHTIRKIATPTGVATVTTIAGSAGSVGNANGLGSAARFNTPFGVVATAVNSLYVSDGNNHTIRRALPTAAPAITSANNATFTLNSAGTFTVTATGSPAPTFSITVGSLPSGVSLNATTGVISGTATAGGSFPITLQASNGVGSAATQAFTLTVNQAPLFTSANNATFSLGVGSTFTLTASGTPAPTFGLVSGSFPPWASLNTSTGAISGTPSNTTGSPFSFTVSATNTAGSVTQAFTLTVGAASPAAIVINPSSTAVNVGLNASFTAAASGNPTPTLQWQRQPAGGGGFSNLSEGGTYTGTTTGTLTVVGVTAPMSGDQFQLVASNIGATVTSTAATLSINSAVPAFVTQPQSTTVLIGNTGLFTAVASGNPTPTLRWQRLPVGGFVFSDLSDDATYSGTTGNVLSVSNATIGMNGDQFRSVATNTNGVVQSNAATLTVSANAPVITLQPVAVTTNVGALVTFTANATGAPDPAFRWQRQPNGTTGFVDLADGGPYSGTQTTTLTIPAATAGMNGDLIRLVAINAGGSTPSNAVLLTLNLGTTISLFAGQATVPGAFDATGLAARFNNPSAIAVDTSGNFYIADSGNSIIRKMTPSGVVTTLAGLAGVRGAVDGPAGSARFNSPSGVAVDGVGNVYVSDTFNHTIRVISSGGNVTTLAGSSGSSGTADGTGDVARFFLPGGLAVDAGGNIYVADSSNHAIRRITSGGSVSTLAGTQGLSGFVNATGSTARFNNPQSVALDSAGNVYVADSLNNAIRKVTPFGAVTTLAGHVAGSPGSADGNGAAATFFRPSGIALDASGNVFVSETINNTLRRITPGGDVTTLAGLATAVGATDGIGSVVRFNRPFGLVVDINGNLYIADTGNHTIRRTGSTTAPQITTQPANRAAGLGQSATFTVAASGSPTPSSYQWQRQPANTIGFANIGDGSSYAGTATASLTVSGVSLVMVGDQFRVVVSNGVAPIAVSEAATLTIGTPLIITSADAVSFRALQANSFTVTTDSGTPVAFTASGLPAWATLNSNTGVLSGNPPDTAGSPFTLTIGATNGILVTQTFTLTILPANLPPTIATQPAGSAIDPGQSVAFSVGVTGTAPFSYQWRRNGTALAGATSSSFNLTGVQAASSGVYSVVVTNAFGTATSAGAALVVNSAPEFTLQPQPQIAQAGGSVSFSAAAGGSGTLAYQWRRNGVAIAGATGTSFAIGAVSASEVGNYDVQVTNSIATVQSSTATLALVTAATAPQTTLSPIGRTVLVGGSATFTAAATGAPTPAYQWRKNGIAIPGANGPTLAFSNAQVGDAALYDVVFTNSAGTATTASAALTVITRSYAGTYFGTYGGGLGSWALYVRDDNTGVFLSYLPFSSAPIMSLNVIVGDNGQFTFSQSAIAAVGEPGGPARAAALQPVTLTATIASNGNVTGEVNGGAVGALSGTVAPVNGGTLGVAGFYQAGSSANSAVTYTIAGPNGLAYVVAQAGAVFDGGAGTVTGAGVVSVSTGRSIIVENISADAGLISGSSTGLIVASALSGGSDVALARQRLLNISTRARVGTAENVLIAGFVISGQQSKPVLIRAVGPTLGLFGVPGVLATPRIELFRGNTSLAVNAGIAGNRAAIDAAGVQAGAFALGAAGTDAAILVTLPPGAYSAQVSSTGTTTGIALVEVYDLSAPAPGQKLLNISTRAAAGAAENQLTAGFVVPGGTSKRVLIRGVGPGLTVFGVPGVLAQPTLTLTRGGTQVATNTNWSTSADAAVITASSAQVGAFALANNDSAVVVTLTPGNYSATVTGAAAAPNGVALIEVYELP
ncbi:MAG: putative Ig domain-containing protein [Opitutaceae bacterium]|nr:putative Ig domain-containing protein [Opitutaceae bacterium]